MSPRAGRGRPGMQLGTEGALQALLPWEGRWRGGCGSWDWQTLAGYEFLCLRRKARVGIGVAVQFLRVGGPFAF